MFRLFRHNLRKLVTLLVAVVLLAFGLATPAQADITTFTTFVGQSMLKTSYVYTAPFPASQGILKITSSVNPELIWEIGTPTEFESLTNGYFYTDPKDLTRTTNALCSPGPCSSTLISSPEIYTTPEGKSFLPNGTYTTQLSFLNTMGTVTTSSLGSAMLSVHAAPPSIANATSTTVTTSRLTLRFPQSLKSTGGDRANLTLNGQGSCSSAQATLTFGNPVINFDHWLEIDFRTQASSSSLTHEAIGLETLVQGCTYKAELRYKDYLSRPPHPTDVNSPTWSSSSITFNAPSVPDAPTNPVISNLGNSRVNLDWIEPEFTGFSPIIYHWIVLTPSDGSYPLNYVCGEISNCTLSGVSLDIEYTVTVQAVNAVGMGAALEAGTFYPTHCDLFPSTGIDWSDCDKSNGNHAGVDFSRSNLSNAHLSNVDLSNANLTNVNLSGADLSGANLTNANLTSVNLANANLTNAELRGATGSGITNSDTAILPTNWVVDSGTLATIPEAPSSVTVIPALRSAQVSWVAGANNGSAIRSYTVTSIPSRSSCSTTETTCTIANLLPNVNYAFKVVATNLAGLSPESLASSSIKPFDLPLAPTKLAAKLSKGSAKFTWTKTTNAGGRPVTRYTVTITPGNKSCISISNSCTIVGLKKKQKYTATIKVQTALGSTVQTKKLTFVGK